jgi:uncharacterized protein YqeY
VLDRIKNDLKDAMRGKDALAVATLRMLIAQLQYARIEAGHDLQEPEVLVVLERAVKTRREAIEQFEKGGRADLASKERAEIVIVQRYLPEAMSPEAVAAAVDALIRELGATSKKDLGRVMKEFMARHRGRVDGKSVNALLAARLP